MIRMKTSIVAWSFLGAVTAFAVLYVLLPYDRFLDLSLASAFGVSLAGIIRYGRDAWRASRQGRTGAEFLLVAVFVMFCTLFSQRVWGMTLRILDRPDWLVDSYFTIAIPWMLAWAMSLAVVAPDIDLSPTDERSGLWKSVALFIGGALAGFVVAASFGVKTNIELSGLSMWPQYVNRPPCPASEPVWVSSKGIYHTAASPYRSGVIARWCFATVEEAEKAGFRSPRGLKKD